MAQKKLTVAAYYFPGWHADPQCERWHGQGWTEWTLLEQARPRFAGHRQPIVPAGGAFDEADPAHAATQIDLAADHEVNCFLFDWYYYDGIGPFLNRALDDGFLASSNRQRMTFALMWANHEWLNIHPADYLNKPTTLARNVGPEAMPALARHVAERYFAQPNYFRLDGKPYFSIYDLGSLVRSMGGIDGAARALDQLRDAAREVGAGDLHLNAVYLWDLAVLPSETKVTDVPTVLRRLGIDSGTSYVWVHDYNPNNANFPLASFADALRAAEAAWERYGTTLSLPYFPNVTMGWDPSPRTVQTDRYDNRGYPFTGVMQDNSPGAFGDAMRRAISFAMRAERPETLVTVNAWNEWTEGSYLLPDTVHGLAYLEAVRDAVKRRDLR